MSRSYKKNPVATNSGSAYRRFAKNQANRRARKIKEIPDGKFFKKLYSSWDICDFKYFCTEESPWWPYWKARMK